MTGAMAAPELTFSVPGEPVLTFQPVVDLADGRLLGMEALIRWKHPRLGQIGPDRLLPMAKSHGDIVQLNQWVLAASCGQARDWSPSVQLAVNCHTSQLRNGDAVRAVYAALESSGLGASQLTLEISEATASDEEAIADLRALSAMGVLLAVDDVGTAWSSFEPIRRLEADIVKIDRTFVAGLEPSEGVNRMVVESVVHLAHSSGMSAIVEGVETAHQVDLARSFDADGAQGFFFARPLSAEDATAMASAPVVPRYSRTEPLTLLPDRQRDGGRKGAGPGKRARDGGKPPKAGSPKRASGSSGKTRA
jgi:EAL domain-containing protein (putative c-di-GMP-specific phosphodiesterase class I)